MDTTLNQINTEVYSKCSLEISNFKLALESKEYYACQFELNGKTILSRNAKITPKKIGQFVTFWKRNNNGIIEPFNEIDSFDFYVVHARNEDRLGQFVFPKSILIKKGILSTKLNEGKRAFRVYPLWDVAKNKQAIQSQTWQLKYFYEVNASTHFKKVSELYIAE